MFCDNFFRQVIEENPIFTLVEKVSELSQNALDNTSLTLSEPLKGNLNLLYLNFRNLYINESTFSNTNIDEKENL